jgi:hypothetical protein
MAYREVKINLLVLSFVHLDINDLLQALLDVELLEVLSEISIFHLSEVKEVLTVEQHHFGGCFGYLVGILQHLELSPDLFLDVFDIIDDVFLPSTHKLNNLFDVNFGGILLHHDTVERIS